MARISDGDDRPLKQAGQTRLLGRRMVAATLALLVTISAGAASGGIAAVADAGQSGHAADGGPATAARLSRSIQVSRRGEPTLRVRGRQLVNGLGQTVQLRGVNRAVFESRCTYDSTGVADGPVDQPSVSAIRAWGVDVVRVTLNEDCWLGINGLPLGGDAAGYRAAVTGYVGLLRANGLYVVLVPLVSAPGAHQSTRIDYMPDSDHMPAFWRSVAATFKADHGMIFDAINEVGMASWNNPHPSPPGQWNCWRNGCTLDSVSGGRFLAAGLQSLVTAIRSQGATQPILLGGIDYNADLSQLLSYLPADPRRQLIASAHIYDFAVGAGVDAMFASQLAPIAKQAPVILGELGERYCDSGAAAYTSHVLSLVDGQETHGDVFGVLGWTWNARTSASTGWNCPTGPFGQGGPLLIRDYTGTPTVMGGVLRAWIGSKTGNP